MRLGALGALGWAPPQRTCSLEPKEKSGPVLPWSLPQLAPQALKDSAWPEVRSSRYRAVPPETTMQFQTTLQIYPQCRESRPGEGSMQRPQIPRNSRKRRLKIRGKERERNNPKLSNRFRCAGCRSLGDGGENWVRRPGLFCRTVRLSGSMEAKGCCPFRGKLNAMQCYRLESIRCIREG